jgi:periplasmic divalent cation tolerance protein
LLIKTTRGLFDALREFIERAHSYDVPEIIACPVVDGSLAYLEWIYAGVESVVEES